MELITNRNQTFIIGHTIQTETRNLFMLNFFHYWFSYVFDKDNARVTLHSCKIMAEERSDEAIMCTNVELRVH